MQPPTDRPGRGLPGLFYGPPAFTELEAFFNQGAGCIDHTHLTPGHVRDNGDGSAGSSSGLGRGPGRVRARSQSHQIHSSHISPEEFSVERRSLEGLTVNSAARSSELIRAALSGVDDEAASKAADIITLNAGATIYVSGIAATLADGVAMAEDAISSRLAAQKLDEFVTFTQMMREEG